MKKHLLVLLVVSLWASLDASAQTKSPSSTTEEQLTMRCDPPEGSLGQLSRAQKKSFFKSQDEFIAGRYTDALKELRGLLAQLQPNSAAHRAMAERTAESALFAGERAYVITLLKPLEEHDGSDCSARTLLARAYAENEQTAERDAEINALTALHRSDPKSPAGLLDVFLLEQHSLDAGGRVEIWYALRPFGHHNTNLVSIFFNRAGDKIVRIELDSDDGDQVYFRETHPDMAAKGERRYSLDAFEPDPSQANGEQHALIRFFEGKPSYDSVREFILAAAKRVATPAT